MPVEPDRFDRVTRAKDHSHPYGLFYTHSSPQIAKNAHHFTDDSDVAGAIRIVVTRYTLTYVNYIHETPGCQ